MWGQTSGGLCGDTADNLHQADSSGILSQYRMWGQTSGGLCGDTADNLHQADSSGIYFHSIENKLSKSFLKITMF